MISVREQLREIRRQLLMLMEQELNAWEDERVAQISEDAHRREADMQGARDFNGVVWAETVDKPTEKDWDDFHAQRRVKSRALAAKGEAAYQYWKAELQNQAGCRRGGCLYGCLPACLPACLHACMYVCLYVCMC